MQTELDTVKRQRDFPSAIDLVDRVAVALADRVDADAPDYTDHMQIDDSGGEKSDEARMHTMLVRIVHHIGPHEVNALMVVMVSALILIERYLRRTHSDADGNYVFGLRTIQTLYLSFYLLCVKVEDDYTINNLFEVVHRVLDVEQAELVYWERHVCSMLAYSLAISDDVLLKYVEALQSIQFED